MAINNDLHHKSCIIIPNDLSYIPLLLNYVQELSKQIGFDEKNIRKIQIAVEEASVNVIQNAFSPDEDAEFEITFTKKQYGLEICIHDKGLPVDQSMRPNYSPDVSLEDQTGRGLGGFLMKEFVDVYEFHNLGTEGKETRLLKYLETKNIVDKNTSKPAPEIVKPPQKDRRIEPIDFDIRLMRSEEAVEVSRCVYDSYGYSYANENIYYPDRVAAMNKSGELSSAIAVTPSGETVGHCALIFCRDLPPEIGIAATKKKFRGQGIARKLGEYLAEQAMSMEIKGLQVKEVTAHPYSQQFCQKLGYKDCGFLLAHSPQTLSFKGIADELSQRNTDVLGFKYLNKPEAITIFPPKRHKKIIEAIYKSLDVPVIIRESNSMPSEIAETIINVSVNSIRSLGEIKIPCYGSDIKDVLKYEMRRLRAQETRVTEMYLNLTDPLTPYVVSIAENLNFFFTGILPGTKGGDSIVMQNMNGVQIEYDAITVVSDTAKALLEYVKQCDPLTV